MNINLPSIEEVYRYLKKWEEEPEFIVQDKKDKCLIKLFNETYPRNVDMDEVLIKVCSLNDLYNANIYSNYRYPVAKHIVDLNFDPRLLNHDLNVVNEIAEVEVDGLDLKKRNFYSFATKYFSLHFEKMCPIYDSIVDDMLWLFKKEDDFFKFLRRDLKCYKTFYKVLFRFRKNYKLECFNFKEIDRYLWTAGKEHFK